MKEEFQFLTFNIHKGFSFLNHTNTLEEIRHFLETTHPDIVFLQEVRGLHLKGDIENQLEHLSDKLWDYAAYGKNAVYTHSHHGNAILSKFPFESFENYDVSLNPFEKRGILYGKIKLGKMQIPIHLFCLHFNLLERDRYQQARLLMELVDKYTSPEDPVIVAGDFNDWRGVLVETLEKMFTVPTGKSLATFPSLFPFFELDRIFVRNIEIQSIEVIRNKMASRLSDHLPLMATMTVFMGC